MEVNKATISKLLKSDAQFAVPVYQRNYAWQKEQCETLFSDMMSILKDENAEHFLGTIVYLSDGTASNRKYIVIDGQQRLTSILLFLKALQIKFRSSPKVHLIDNYLYDEDETKYKLIPIEKDFPIYNAIMDIKDEMETGFDEKNKNNRLYNNYHLFYDLISKSGETDLTVFTNVIKRLTLAEIELDQKDQPQMIFESINSTGLDLTNTDLLRNYLLMSLDYDKQSYLYKNYWLPIENNAETDDGIDNFVATYLTFKRKTDSIIYRGRHARINNKNIYETFKQFGDAGYKQIEDRLTDMKICSTYYHRISNPSKNNEIDRRLYELNNEIGYMLQSAPLLFYLLSENEKGTFTDEQVCDMLDIIISYIVRLRLHGNSPSRQFFALLIQKLETKIQAGESIIDAFWKAIQEGNGSYRFPNNDEFVYDLCNRELYEGKASKICRYILYKLEKTINIDWPDEENVSIEHILPQTVSDKWIEDLNNAGEPNIDNLGLYTHKLGNLTLVKIPVNGLLSNSPYKDKCEIYEASGYKCTNNIPKKYAEWTTDSIQKRSQELAKQALDIWKYKEIQNEAETEKKKEGTLNISFDNFTGEKPAELIINGSVRSVTSWRNMAVEIIKYLYALDKSMFMDMIRDPQTGKKLKTIIFEGETYGDREVEYFKDNLYIARWMIDTINILNKISIMVEYYSNAKDEYSGLFDSVEFKLK